MKVRESGMPEQEVWASFFDVSGILSKMEIDSDVHDLIEIGFGYGTFTIPAAQRISGTIYAFDIEQEMAVVAGKEIRANGINNVHLEIRDVLEQGTGLEEAQIDYIMLFNILHLENPEVLLQEAFRVLKPGGKVGVIHWRSDISTPRGPDLDIRPTPEDILDQFKTLPFAIHKLPFVIEPYHIGLIASKEM
ncbi:hypothetical protein GEMRC1_001376 [Eukaryota sp. GEM-RC1]